MSYVFNMVGGGGLSRGSAILTVTVPTGSTVTMTKSSLSLRPTIWASADDNTLDCALFTIPPSMFDSQNAWTVEAVRSGYTASGTVTIDSNKQYEMALSFNYYLFESGRGAVVALTSGAQSNASITVEQSKITVSSTSLSNLDLWLNNTTAIDLLDYSKLVVVSAITSRSNASDYGGILFVSNTLVTSSRVNTSSNFVAKTLITESSESQATELDISNIDINGYVGIKGKMTGIITEIYLAK